MKANLTPSVDDPWFASLQGHEVGSFKLTKYIGHGRIGVVYLAQSKEIPLFRPALKLIPGSPRPGWENELNKVAALSTISNVVHFHGNSTGQISHSGRTAVFQYTIWDYIPPGRNLNQYLEETRTFTVSFLMAVLETVLRVLHGCHIKEVKRHGDLHAGNILIGESDGSDRDDNLQTRLPVYVSDFGYGATGQVPPPKDDYDGLAQIFDKIARRVDWKVTTPADRQCLLDVRQLVKKLLLEQRTSEKAAPLEVLQSLVAVRNDSRVRQMTPTSLFASGGTIEGVPSHMKAGQFQVSEMLGDNWLRWKQLFVASVPARSRVLEPDITTVVTGPRGCGKTMLFRRLSERATVECGPIDDSPDATGSVGLYLNANDIGDAFAYYPDNPDAVQSGRLVCYTHLCIVSELCAVQAARQAKFGERASEGLLAHLNSWFRPTGVATLLTGEDPLERSRSDLERLKWEFPKSPNVPDFPGYTEMSRHDWLRSFVHRARGFCSWLGSKPVLILVDDYTTPRVSRSMQRVLNRVLFQRSADFVCKIATESATTFVTEDSSGKNLQDGDDYQLVDMGEESLFLSEDEREAFLNEVFSRRLALDQRVPEDARTLPGLLGALGISKTEFARRLRNIADVPPRESDPLSKGHRRGNARAKVLYHGTEVFTSLWSGDTRTMIQLVQDLLDEPSAQSSTTSQNGQPHIDPELQDRVFRNRGGAWLASQSRNLPTETEAVNISLKSIEGFSFAGGDYGSHLKAIVEAFAGAARDLLLGPVYTIRENNSLREVPRMAFRIEILDDFRLDGLALHLYSDLLRYGLFMRDARGKSVRGAMVPRLYLRRLLLAYCTLPLSKRDAVTMTCERFRELLLFPDVFNRGPGNRFKGSSPGAQSFFPFAATPVDPLYDDLADEGIQR